MKRTTASEQTLLEYDRAIVSLKQLLHDEPSDLDIPVLKNLRSAYRGRALVLKQQSKPDEARLAQSQADKYDQRFQLVHANSTE